MLLLDANPLIYALRSDVPAHRSWSKWLEETLGGREPVGVCNATLATVMRIATSPRVFPVPTPLDDTMAFIDDVRNAPAFLAAEPGPQHWGLVERLCRRSHARGNLVMDAYVAALAMELGSTLVTADGDFARFSGLRLHNPFEA